MLSGLRINQWIELWNFVLMVHPTGVISSLLRIYTSSSKLKKKTTFDSHILHVLQVYDNKSDLLTHSQVIHRQNPKPYKCHTCHKCFSNSSYLSQHNRIHAGIKPFQCKICERRFTQQVHLQQHMRYDLHLWTLVHGATLLKHRYVILILVPDGAFPSININGSIGKLSRC